MTNDHPHRPSPCCGGATITRRETLTAGLRALLLASVATIPMEPSLGAGRNRKTFAKPRYFGVFRELPVGAVQARGWLAGWLDRQVSGMSGHPETQGYPYDTGMFVGRIPPGPHGEPWWPYEQAGYYVDAAVRLDALVKSPRIAAIAKANIDFINADHAPGRLAGSTEGWPNAVVGRALMAQHSRTGSARTLNTLKTLLAAKPSFSGRDGYVIEQMLYVYGATGDPALLASAKTGFESYFLTDPKSFSNQKAIASDVPFTEHGVTAAEQLKLAPLYYTHSGDERALKLAQAAYTKALRDSMMPDGGLVSSEHLGPLKFDSMHETCDIADWSWSLGYMLMADGAAAWADSIEKMVFNALPGAVTKDFKQHQYFSLPNQLLASNTQSTVWGPSRIAYRAGHDTECCSGNVHRVMPNYVNRMWMQTPDGLAATLYGPSEVTTSIGGQKVTIVEDTDYPFRETIRFTVKADRPARMTLTLRIPSWCDGAAVSVNGVVTDTRCPADSFVALARMFNPGDVVELSLPMAVKTPSWFAEQAISVERGPLVFAVPVAEQAVVSWIDPPEIKVVMNGNSPKTVPAIEFYPVGEWRYGVMAEERLAAQLTVREQPMTDNPFAPGQSPVGIDVTLARVADWYPDWNPKPVKSLAQYRTRTGPPIIEENYQDFPLAPKNPAKLPGAISFAKQAGLQKVMMVPYGATHLRLTTLPVLKA